VAQIEHYNIMCVCACCTNRTFTLLQCRVG